MSKAKHSNRCNFVAGNRKHSLSSFSCYFPSTHLLSQLHLLSCAPWTHCTVAPADLLSVSCPTQVRDTVHWRRCCLYLIPLLFIVLESLASMPPTPSPPCPVQFPRDPHSLPGWPGWNSLREEQVGSRQGYRFQPSPCTHTPYIADSSSATPHLACVRLSGALRNWNTLKFTRSSSHTS